MKIWGENKIYNSDEILSFHLMLTSIVIFTMIETILNIFFINISETKIERHK